MQVIYEQVNARAQRRQQEDNARAIMRMIKNEEYAERHNKPTLYHVWTSVKRARPTKTFRTREAAHWYLQQHCGRQRTWFITYEQLEEEEQIPEEMQRRMATRKLSPAELRYHKRLEGKSAILNVG